MLQVEAVVTCRGAVVTAEHLQGQAGDRQRRISLSEQIKADGFTAPAN